jgi:hypothetical protein
VPQGPVQSLAGPNRDGNRIVIKAQRSPGTSCLKMALHSLAQNDMGHFMPKKLAGPDYPPW